MSDPRYPENIPNVRRRRPGRDPSESDIRSQIDAQRHTRKRISPAAETPDSSSFSTSQLYRPIHPLIGRESAIAELEHLLRHPATRLLTLTGAGGSGKTTLAVHATESTVDSFPGGTVSVSLAAVSSTALVMPTVARALGLQEGRSGHLETRVAAAIGTERTLLVLDNFEHVIEAAPGISRLLQACPALVVLVTSRTRLRLQGEREVFVPPLTTLEETEMHPDRLPTEAGMLFIDRMLAMGTGKQPSDEEVLTIEKLCRRLDGLPLAIELAVPWTKLLSTKELLERLDPQLPLLVSGHRDAPGRQRTMRATIQWSYDLLSKDEKAFFRTLGVFRGGFTLEAAEAVSFQETEVRSADQLLTGISSLVEKSLLTPIPSHTGVPRFTLLETLREFAYEMLTEAWEADAIQERHCRHFLSIAERYGPLLQWQQDTAGSISRLEEEQENIRAALSWSHEHDRDAFLRLASALESYWGLRGKLHEGREWLDRALVLSENAPLLLRSAVVRSCAWNARSLNEFERADELGKLGAELSKEAGDRYGTMHALTALGFSAFQQGLYDKSLEIYLEVLQHAEALDEPVWVAWQTRNVARASLALGDLETARKANRQAISLFRQVPCLHGEIEAQDGEALLATHDGDLELTVSCWRKRMASVWDEPGFLIALFGMIDVALKGSMYESVAQLLGAYDAQSERLGITFRPLHRDFHKHAIETASGALEASHFHEAWQYGHGLSVQEARKLAVDFADTFSKRYTARDAQRSDRFGLTQRELEVIDLVATGQSNRQIADTLFISMPTVKRHLSNIYGKLGVTTRDDAVAVLSRTP